MGAFRALNVVSLEDMKITWLPAGFPLVILWGGEMRIARTKSRVDDLDSWAESGVTIWLNKDPVPLRAVHVSPETWVRYIQRLESKREAINSYGEPVWKHTRGGFPR